MALINCPECKSEVSSSARQCPKCGHPIDTSIKCPKCGSSDTGVITAGKKIMSQILWGNTFSKNTVNSKYVCNKCKHKF